jgi:PKD domain
LINSTTATPSFIVDVVGNYTIQLIVTDSLGLESNPADVTVTFDLPPVANAGPSQAAVVGQTVTLNGSGSIDYDGQPLTYKWSVVSAPSGSTAAISNSTAEIASFVPDVAGTYAVQLVVNDGILTSAPATAEIEASPQTVVFVNIADLEKIIEALPPSAFRSPSLQQDLIKQLNAVIVSLTAHEYVRALRQVYQILSEVDGCAISGRPRTSDWITNCEDQSLVVGPLIRLIDEIAIEIINSR